MPKNIHDILRDVDSGKLAIPDFQRKLAWEQEDIKNLLSSILGEYHIGTLLLLESKSDCPFKYRKVTGATTEIDSNFQLILDGQQRVTASVVVQ